jgi:hypothetical protein
MTPAHQPARLAILAAALLLAPVQPTVAQSPRPFYRSIPVTCRAAPPAGVDASDIILTDATGAAPATSVDEANTRLCARAAAAVRFVAHHDSFLKEPGTSNVHAFQNEQNFGLALLAQMAYKDYFDDDSLGDGYRARVCELLTQEHPLVVGTSPDKDVATVHYHWHGEYDVVLQAYIALYYKYFAAMPEECRAKLLSELLSVRGPYPFEGPPWALTGLLLYPFHEVNAVGVVNVVIPETENHSLMIETARYLTNQLLYQQEVEAAAVAGRAPRHDLFDNNRNGGGDNIAAPDFRPPLVAVILQKLQSILSSDFNEYNSRDYQNYTMVALLNLATYAYDDRVRLAARMALDYVSAKVAVSSNNLARSTPYRRLNEERMFGPVLKSGGHSYLNTSLVNQAAARVMGDPQTGFYSLLAGNTAVWNGHAGAANYEMVHAGLRDYRIPSSVLDIFVNAAHRRFYQRFHHDAYTMPGNTGQYADEIYAASPNYLISAGGNPTYFSAVVMIGGGTNDGGSADLGVALPTTFLPTAYTSGFNLSLASLIQLGTVGTDITVTRNAGVAPDFACGDLTYLPSEYTSGFVDIPTSPGWMRHFYDASAAGYFLAISGLNFSPGQGGSAPGFMDASFLEAFDTSLHPGVTFEAFVAAVKAKTASTAYQFPGENTYETFSGQRILFRLSHGGCDIISTSDVPASQIPWTGWNSRFASGTVLNSEQGSGLVTISNPAFPRDDGALGTQIVLDMRDGLNHPRRISESGDVEIAGVPHEVWVNFRYSGSGQSQNGDFGDPFKTLTAARDKVAPGGTIKIVAGVATEPIVIKTRMNIQAVGGTATIRGQ